MTEPPCEACGAAAGEPHRTDEGQHDITGVLSIALPPLDLAAIFRGGGRDGD